MEDYLTFKKMITPVIIQIVFWVLAALAVIGGLFTLTQNLIGGILFILLGPIVVRVYAEILIVLFEMNSALQDIRAQGTRSGGTPTA